MKPLDTKTVNGQTFHPCYTVNDWGVDGWFIGTDYQQSASGTHSIAMQTDHRIEREFAADVLWPDGEIRYSKITAGRPSRTTIGDHGNNYDVSSPVWVVCTTARGAGVEVRATELYFDLSTITELAPKAIVKAAPAQGAGPRDRGAFEPYRDDGDDR